MVDSLITAIKENILNSNPATFTNAYAGARQYQDGAVIIYENGEGTYVGLQDSQYNYFYIRYTDEPISLDEAAERKTACNELQGTVFLRLVAWVWNGNINKLSEVLLHDLLETDFSTITAADKQRFVGGPKIITPVEFTLDPEEVYKQETGQEDEQVRLAKNATIIAMDFGILFNYSPYGNRGSNCLDRSICTDVCS